MIPAPIKRMIFGDSLLPQEFTIGLVEPQKEVTVWLHGSRKPLDVTWKVTTACCAPLMMCVAFDAGEFPAASKQKLMLRYRAREGQGRLLGEMQLTAAKKITVGETTLVLFNVPRSKCYCLSQTRLWAYYIRHACEQFRYVKNPDVKMTLKEQRAAMITFIRPHPLSLGSIQADTGGNIFPMNLMGELGSGLFGFALKDSRRAAHLVEKTRKIALSSVPLEWSPLAHRYAVHHTKDSIDWSQLPFALRDSEKLCIPVPRFASRVRELQVEAIHPIGSHTFFVARVVSDQAFSHEPVLHAIHGLYQAWRMRGSKAELEASVRLNQLNKYGSPDPTSSAR
jgi:flavin reductase (DIM6/NTAB) family NADH-FMN oxidoreductase RutF